MKKLCYILVTIFYIYAIACVVDFVHVANVNTCHRGAGATVAGWNIAGGLLK